FYVFFFFFSSRRRHTRSTRDWSSDVCSSDLGARQRRRPVQPGRPGLACAARHRLERRSPGPRLDPRAETCHGTSLRRHRLCPCRSEERRVGKESNSWVTTGCEDEKCTSSCSA